MENSGSSARDLRGFREGFARVFRGYSEGIQRVIRGLSIILEHDPRLSRSLVILRSGEFSVLSVVPS